MVLVLEALVVLVALVALLVALVELVVSEELVALVDYILAKSLEVKYQVFMR